MSVKYFLLEIIRVKYMQQIVILISLILSNKDVNQKWNLYLKHLKLKMNVLINI